MAITPPQDEDRFYKGDSLIRVFAISSIVMLVFTIWMVLDDFGREWKGYQRRFFEIKKEKFAKQIEETKATVDQAKIDELKTALANNEKALEAKGKDIERVEKELTKAKTKEGIAIGNYQDEKAEWDVKKYHYEAEFGHEEAHHLVEQTEHAAAKPAEGEAKEAKGHSETSGANPKAQKERDKLLKDWEKVVEKSNAANLAVQEKQAKEAELAAFYLEQKKFEKDLKIARGDLDRLEEAKKNSELTMMAMMRSAPIVDLANPTFRLQQVVLPQIRDDIYFSQVQKVDRCTTCHQAIDTPGFEDQANPFKTHPRLDLMLGSRSPHPIDKIGCTVCHEGRGPSTHFSRSAHTPQNEAQRKIWEEKYGYYEVHHIIERMLPLQFTEGKCRVCHKGTEYVPKAEKLNHSVQLIKASGCYGCHRIEGWDHIRKPAPSLKKIKGKVTKDWIVKWVRDPKAFNDHARMPSSFFQSNITSDEFKQYNEAEIQGIADFLYELSEDYTPNVRIGGGSAEQGKALFGSVGCLGCHQIDDFPRAQGKYVQAPDLSTVGSKVTRDWLTSWLKNPNHYWTETTMPSLRLSEGEIADLASYLTSKKNPTFEAADAGKADLETQKKVMRLYYLRDPKMAPATEAKIKETLDKMNPKEISVSLGKNAVGRYGCFGCHEIKGYETTQGIGTELSDWGSKPINKLDFGLMPIERTNYHWADQKLRDTRSFDTGVVKEYLDLLRMPDFGFSEDDRKAITLALLGLTSQKIEASKRLNAREYLMEEGQRVVHKYNCQGCHVAEMMHQPLPENHPGFEEHAKKKYLTEGRILRYYEDDETLGPPPLVTQGERVQTAWVHNFVKDPSEKLRRILKVRMPTFKLTNDEMNKLVTYWAAFGNLEFPYVDKTHSGPSAGQIEVGRNLYNKLQCANCHTTGESLTAADLDGGSKGLAPDLKRAGVRLNKKWIVELLADPQKKIPGTRMPGFWADGVSPFPEILKGNSTAQQEAVADYVLSLGGRLQAQPSAQVQALK